MQLLIKELQYLLVDTNEKQSMAGLGIFQLMLQHSELMRTSLDVKTLKDKTETSEFKWTRQVYRWKMKDTLRKQSK